MTIGPTDGGYYLTPCFEATLMLAFRLLATFFVLSQICYTWSLPSLHFLRSRVAFESSRRRQAGGKGGGALSSIASASIASALLHSEDSNGAFKMQQPLLDDSSSSNDIGIGKGFDPSGSSYQPRRRKSTIHQEAALARFPGVPAPRPGPLRRGDEQYLQTLRQSLQADKRDNEGNFPRIAASMLLVTNLALSVLLLLSDALSATSSETLPPHLASSILQCIAWSGSLVLIFLEWKKGVHTSGFVRAVWACMWLAMLVTTYDDIASRLETSTNTTSYDNGIEGHLYQHQDHTAITHQNVYLWIQFFLSSCLVGVAVEVHRRHTKSDLYTLESEATVLMQLHKNPNLNNFRRLLLLASVDLSILLIGFFGAMVASGSNIGFQVMFGTIIQDIFLKPHMLDTDTGIQMIFCIGMFLGNLLQMGFIEMAGTRLVTRVQRYTFAAIVEQDMGFFDVHQTGELTTVLTANTALVRNGATTQLALALKGFVQFISILTYLCITNGVLTGFFMGIALIPLGVAGMALTCVSKITKNMTDSQGQQGAIAEEHVGGIRTVSSFSMQEKAKSKYDHQANISNYWGVLLSWVQGSTFAFVIGGFYMALSFAQWRGGHLIEGDNPPLTFNTKGPGQLVAFVQLAVALVIGLGNVMSALPEVAKATGAAEKIFEFMDRKPAVNYQGGLRPVVPPSGNVSFEDVTFAYPSRPDKIVLKSFTLRIHAGQQIALVGASGSGKSTVLSLMERFYDPQAGIVTLDGVNVQLLDPMWLREYIGFVMQEPVLFSGTITQNIRYGRPLATDEEVRESARVANAHDFITRLPEGYDTMVGQGGAGLSGGQKQRIAIARALVKNPSVLLLDEATSALDAESEYLVQQALDRLMAGRTTIIVAHRLSTIQNSDVINVFASGHIVESGAHDELVALGGAYSELVAKQQKKETEEAASSKVYM
jgi:ABC-type multidrug transport system fused ATPase/permease subunit